MDLTCGSGRFDDDSSNDQTAMHTTINNGSDGQQDVKPLTPAQELRKATKPLMEKRRRARINQCLQELKDLILEALNKDPARHNKLEKADILEMAVVHLKNVHRQNLQTPPPPAECVGKYRAGFTECANEVSRFVNNVNVLQPEVKQKLIGHLSSCISTLDASPITPAMGYPTVHSPPSQLELQGGHGAATPPLSYSPFPPNSPSSNRSSPPVALAPLVAFPGMLPPYNQDLNNNNTDAMHHDMDIGADEDDAPLDFSKKYSPTHPGTTGGFPNPRKKYLASVSRGSSSSSSEELPHSSSDVEMHLSPSEPVNYSKNVYGGASAPRFSFDEDHRFFMCDEDDDMWRPW